MKHLLVGSLRSHLVLYAFTKHCALQLQDMQRQQKCFLLTTARATMGLQATGLQYRTLALFIAT
jgi:hypothetical protein